MNERIDSRLARIESRLVEGFMQLGANVKEKPDERIIVDAKRGEVYIPHVGVSVGDIVTRLPDDDHDVYDVLCNGKLICVINKE